MIYLGASSGSIVCTCMHAHSYVNNLQFVFMEARGQQVGMGGVFFSLFLFFKSGSLTALSSFEVYVPEDDFELPNLLFLPRFLSHQSTGTVGTHHHAWFIRCAGWNLGFRA